MLEFLSGQAFWEADFDGSSGSIVRASFVENGIPRRAVIVPKLELQNKLQEAKGDRQALVPDGLAKAGVGCSCRSEKDTRR